MSQQKNQREPIRPKQIQLVKMAQKQLGLDDETYRDLLEDLFRVRSCTDLSAAQGDRLIDQLKLKGFVIVSRHPRPRRPKGKNVVHLASRAEIDKLNAVAGLIKWKYSDGLQRFLERRVGIKGGKARTAGEAYRAIEALKKFFENGMKKEHGPEWWTMRFDDPAVMEYIERHCPEEWR